MATDELVVAGGPVDQSIGTLEVENTTLRLSGIELHRVLGGDLAKVGSCESADAALVESVDVTGSAPVPRNRQLEQLGRSAVQHTSFPSP